MNKLFSNLFPILSIALVLSLTPKTFNKVEATTQNYSTDKQTYYSGISETSGLPLLGQLHDLLCDTHKYYSSYNDCKDPNVIYNIEPGSTSNYVTDFYNQQDIEREWYTKVGGWNREHVWCQSLSIDTATGNQLWGTRGGGSDLHHVRPIESTSNSSRNNHPFGLVGSNYKVVYAKDRSGKFVSSPSGKLNTTLDIFEPIDSVKGDVARIIFYVYAHYSDYQYVNGTKNSDDCETFGKLDITNIVNTEEKSEESAWKLLLDWNESDQVSEEEIYRNEQVAKYQGNRNPFIDNPDYANMIWGNEDEDTNTDTLVASLLGTNNSYSVWSGVSNHTKAIYSGRSCGANRIQMNTSSSQKCAIYSSKSAGLIKKVAVDFNDAETSKTLDIYGSNTPYSFAIGVDSDSSLYGTKVGTISQTNTSVEFSFNYKYVCVVPTGGAVYLDNIKFTWNDMNASAVCSTPQTMTGLSFCYQEKNVNIPSYVKVEENLDDFSGKYLIVSSYADVCFDASLTNDKVDSYFNYVEVEITNNVIHKNEEIGLSEVEIIKNGSYYNIKIGDGYYIGNSQSGNNLSVNSSPSTLNNTININKDGTVDIIAQATSTTSYLRYNSSVDQNRFRFYKSDTYTSQKAIYLYRYDESYCEKAYPASDVSMTFGSIVSYSEYKNILDTYDVTGFGVFVAYKNNLNGKSIEKLYKESKEDVSSSKWLNENNIVYSARFLGNENELPCNRTDSTGLPSLEDGDYVTWKVKVNIKPTSYTAKIAAVAYMIIDGEYCFFNQREACVSSLCVAYLNEGLELDETLTNSLAALARLDGNII